MSFKSNINQFRRVVTKSLTKGIVNKNKLSEIQNGKTGFELKRVLISRPNHRLGNTLMITPLVKEIIRLYPNCKIDLFVKGKPASLIFENYPQIDKIIELPRKPFKELGKYLRVWLSLRKNKYDLVIDVVKGSSSGRISTLFAKSDFKYSGDDFEELEKKYPDYIHMAKTPVYNFRHFLEMMGKKEIEAEMPVLDIRLSPDEIKKGKGILNSVTNHPENKTLAFFTYATGEKCFSVEWWNDFYNKFYPRYKDRFNLIEILPVENISQLERKLPTYYSKDVREIASVMANCKLVVAGDSGMMHLSSSSLAPTIGLFSVSSLPMYETYGNYNVSIDTNTQTQDEIIRQIDLILSRLDSEIN